MPKRKGPTGPQIFNRTVRRKWDLAQAKPIFEVIENPNPPPPKPRTREEIINTAVEKWQLPTSQTFEENPEKDLAYGAAMAEVFALLIEADVAL